jgi:hypothetical protein
VYPSAGAILHDDLLTEDRREPRRNDAAEDVGIAPR